MDSVNYFHVDVFATRPITGNGLTVFMDTATWSAPSMLRVAQEMRQFESIFLSEVSPTGARARVFTVEEELPFAGHPLLGAAAVLPCSTPYVRWYGWGGDDLGGRARSHP